VADLVTRRKTSHGYEDLIVGALQFFTAENWRQTEQSARRVTFRGRPEIPWYLLLLMGAGLLALVVPGVALYMLHIRKTYWFTNIVVTATPVRGGTEVEIQYPAPAAKLVQRFVGALPPVEG
jgi:hypothetical protein